MKLKLATTIFFCLVLAGCWNGENTHINLGDVSVGQQLLDLKLALDAGAITPDEYETTKAMLLALTSLCTSTEQDDSWF